MAKTLRRPFSLALAALATTALGGCYYGDVNSGGYASGYACNDSYYDYDPYAYDDGYGYGCYDQSDYGSGFVQIGFGGGWYDSYYYPGYGMWMFDNYRNRYPLRGQYLNYWGGRRAWWKHHGNRGGQHWNGPGRPGRPDGGRPGSGRPDDGKRNWGDHIRDRNAAGQPSTPDRNWTGGNARPDNPGATRPGANRPDGAGRPGGNRPDGATRPGGNRPDGATRPGWSRPDGAVRPAPGNRGERPAVTRPPRPDAASGAPAARPAPAERNRNWGDQMRNRPDTGSAPAARPAPAPAVRTAPPARQPMARPAPPPRPAAPAARPAPAPRDLAPAPQASVGRDRAGSTVGSD